MGSLRTQAARFGAGTPDLSVVAAAGAEAKAEITVPGLEINDIVVSVINLSDGDTEVVESSGHSTLVLKDSTAGDKLLVVFWSVGRGGNPNAS